MMWHFINFWFFFTALFQKHNYFDLIFVVIHLISNSHFRFFNIEVSVFSLNISKSWKRSINRCEQMFINDDIMKIIETTFANWISFRLAIVDVFDSIIVIKMKNAITRNDKKHIFIIFVFLNVVYVHHVNILYDILMLDHAFIVDLFVVSLFSTYLVEMYLDIECDTEMIVEIVKNVIQFRKTLVELILMNAMKFILKIIFARVIKFTLSFEIKIISIEIVCNSQNCRERIRSQLFNFFFLLDLMIAQ